MPWTETTRRQYRREDLRYASDMTDDEWALIEPHLPPPRRLGRPRTTDLRAVVDALLYILASGCQWRLLPSRFSALLDGAAVLLPLARGRHVAPDQS